MTKKGQSVMMFVSVANPVDNSKSTKEFTEKISAQWQQSFFNNHIDAQVFNLQIIKKILQIRIMLWMMTEFYFFLKVY